MVLIQLVYRCDPTFMRNRGVPLDANGQAAALVDVESHLDLERAVTFFLTQYDCRVVLMGKRSDHGYLSNDNPLVCDGDFLYDYSFVRLHNWKIMYDLWKIAGVQRLDILVDYEG